MQLRSSKIERMHRSVVQSLADISSVKRKPIAGYLFFSTSGSINLCFASAESSVSLR